MSTSGNSFELILEEILRQKRILEELHEENDALRQQLAALQAGQGIYIDILGHRIPLAVSRDDSSYIVAAVPVEDKLPAVTDMPVMADTPAQQAMPVPHSELQPQNVASMPTQLIDAVQLPQEVPAPVSVAMEGPISSADNSDSFLLEEVSGDGTPFAMASSSFFEDALFDEFSTASTHQMAVWPGPITDHKPLDEREKAALRRELMGSFLLE